MRYIAELKQEGKNLLVSFPDCPGCQTFGPTRERALAMAAEALEGWLEAHLITGDAPPQPKRRRESSGGGREWVAVAVPPILAVRLQLRWARLALGLSQAALAERVGVSRQQIALLEHPDTNMTLRTLERVARALDLQVEIRLSGQSEAA